MKRRRGESTGVGPFDLPPEMEAQRRRGMWRGGRIVAALVAALVAAMSVLVVAMVWSLGR